MLEILASVALLSIAVLPLLSLLTSAPVLHAQREQQTRAAFLAQLRLEEVKYEITIDFNADYYDDGNPSNDPDGKYNEGGYKKSTTSSTDFLAPDADFRYTISDDEDTDIKEIMITVWYDEDGVVTQNGDGDHIPGKGEKAVRLRSKVARRE